jgi:hypothetical protein
MVGNGQYRLMAMQTLAIDAQAAALCLFRGLVDPSRLAILRHPLRRRHHGRCGPSPGRRRGRDPRPACVGITTLLRDTFEIDHTTFQADHAAPPPFVPVADVVRPQENHP